MIENQVKIKVNRVNFIINIIIIIKLFMTLPCKKKKHSMEILLKLQIKINWNY